MELVVGGPYGFVRDMHMAFKINQSRLRVVEAYLSWIDFPAEVGRPLSTRRLA